MLRLVTHAPTQRPTTCVELSIGRIKFKAFDLAVTHVDSFHNPHGASG